MKSATLCPKVLGQAGLSQALMWKAFLTHRWQLQQHNQIVMPMTLVLTLILIPSAPRIQASGIITPMARCRSVWYSTNPLAASSRTLCTALAAKLGLLMPLHMHLQTARKQCQAVHRQSTWHKQSMQDQYQKGCTAALHLPGCTAPTVLLSVAKPARQSLQPCKHGLRTRCSSCLLAAHLLQ